MNSHTQKLIDESLDSIVQIITPYGTGSGFIISDLIITNSHVVSGLKEVLISTKNLSKTLGDVIYDDNAYDLAFIKLPQNISITHPLLISQNPVLNGDEVIAIGHPYGLNYTTTEGIVSKASRMQDEVEYIQFDAAINPGNSGGPLLNTDVEVVGVNTFIISNSNNLGFALPSSTLQESINEYKKLYPQNAIRCYSCKNLLLESKIKNDYCYHCGIKLDIAKKRREGYRPSGVVALIEEILKSLNKDVPLARRSQRSWRFEDESLRIDINYYDNGVVIADSVLCRIPQDKIETIYDYLLSENSSMEFLGFSISKNNIYLSFVTIDSSLNLEHGIKIFGRLFDRSSTYQKHLIENLSAMKPLFDEFE